MLQKFAFGGVFVGSMISTLLHLGAGGGFYYWFTKREPPPIVAELDLSMSPLVMQAPNAGGGYAKPSESWTTPKKGKAPASVLVEKPQTKEEVVKEELQTAPCTGPNCVEGVGNGTGGGGTGEGEGQYIPVSQTARKPRWIKNFITTSDYPRIARQEGKDGRVVLAILIDDQGRVRDARLLQGSYEAFNEVALRKVKDAIFTPALNVEGNAVSCKVTLPIRFELR